MVYGIQTLSLVLAAGMATAAASAACADDRAASPWVDGAEAQVRLVSGADRQGRPLLGLTFKLRDGWKIFWRSPGAPGLPPQLTWQGSQNLKSARLIWPAPELFTSFGFRARGYGGNVTLPIRIVATDAAKPVKARIFVRYQVCKDVCIPGEARLALTVPVKARPRPALLAALAKTPKPPGDRFAMWQIRLKGRQLIVELKSKGGPLAKPVVIVETQKRLRLGRTGPVKRQGDGMLTVAIPVLGQKPLPPALKARVTVLDGARAWEKTVPVSGLRTR